MIGNRKTFLAALMLGSTLASTPAFAQESQDEDIIVRAQRENETQVRRGGQVGVFGDKDAEDVPFTIKSYNEALILNQQPQTLGQVLENDPSIRTTYGFGNAAEQFVVRGFPLASDDVGLNGLYGIAPRQLIAPELYESVQVLNGASAFLNGAAPGGTGLGGSVNLAAKRAREPLFRATANYAGDAHFGGSFDVARRFGALGQFGLRINGAYRAGDVAVDNEFRRTAVIGAGLDWQGDRARFFLDLAYQRVEVDNLRPKVTLGAGLTAIPRVPRAEANFAQDYTYTEMRDVFGTARFEYDLADNALFYAAFGARDGMEDGIYGGITLTDAATGDGNGTALYVPRTDNNEAAQAGVRVRLEAGGVSHEINFGGSYIWQVNRNAFDFRYGDSFDGFPTNLYAPQQVPLPASLFVGGDLDDPFPISRTRLGSAFASDTIGLLEDRILLTGGLRLQTIDTRGYAASADPALGIGPGDESSRYTESAVTPVAGIVVKPVEGVSLYANRIEALAPGPVAPLGTINVGEIFPPFRSVQYEVGGKLSLGRFNAGLALFQTEQPLAYSVPEGPLFRYGVFGEQRNRGIELSLDGELAPGLRVIAGGSILDAELRETANGADNGNQAPGVPDYLINANVEWDLPFARGLTLTGRVVHTGEQQVNAANTLSIPDWTRVDLGARYVLAVAERPVTLRATVDNVANRRYWASAFDAFGSALLQGAPRTLKLSASVDF